MRKNLSFSLLVALFFIMPMAVIGQNLVTFESLEVPEVGYFNGSTEFTGEVGETQKIMFSENGAKFRVNYTLGDGFDYWNGTAYSNQTDLETASWTNYSAYSTAGGGYDGSANYAFGYIYGKDTFCLEEVSNLNSVYITNSVWAYHYINGSDGVGTGKYEDGDYYKLTFKGISAEGEYTGDSVEFYMADFTNGNSNIVADWTMLDLSALKNCKKVEISCASTDNYTPFYYCLDNLSFTSTNIGIEDKVSEKITFYPNPTTDFITITEDFELAEIFDISGKKMLSTTNSTIDVNTLSNGVYMLKVKKNNSFITTKFVKK